MKKTATRLSGETPWDAIVHHFGLDIVEEPSFEIFCIRSGYDYPRKLPLETLEELYSQWNRFVRETFRKLGL